MSSSFMKTSPSSESSPPSPLWMLILPSTLLRSSDRDAGVLLFGGEIKGSSPHPPSCKIRNDGMAHGSVLRSRTMIVRSKSEGPDLAKISF
jgi:hypothetical protein